MITIRYTHFLPLIKMPSFTDIKIKGFLLGFRAYTRIVHTATKIFNATFRWSLSMVPDKLLWTAYPLNLQPTRSREDVNVVMAKGYSQANETTQDVTNAINLFMNIYWDNMTCDSGGGIQLFKIKEILGGMNIDLLWISYLFRKPDLKITDKPGELIPHLRYMFIDLKKDTVYKYGAYSIPGIIGVEPIEVMFDQISLNPTFEW